MREAKVQRFGWDSQREGVDDVKNLTQAKKRVFTDFDPGSRT